MRISVDGTWMDSTGTNIYCGGACTYYVSFTSTISNIINNISNISNIISDIISNIISNITNTIHQYSIDVG